MPITDEWYEYVVELLVADAFATLGVGHDRTIRHCADNARSFLDDEDAFYSNVIESVQQAFHDEFIDITWPSCPRHPGRPMWLSDAWWRCDDDDVLVARVGELAAVRR